MYMYTSKMRTPPFNQHTRIVICQLHVPYIEKCTKWEHLFQLGHCDWSQLYKKITPGNEHTSFNQDTTKFPTRGVLNREAPGQI